MTRLLIAPLVVAAACASGSRPLPTQRTHHYPDGRPHFQYQLHENVPHGEGLVWHPTGEIKSRGEYVNGLKHGMFRFYSDDGDLLHQAFFYKNVEVWRSTSPNERPSQELLRGLTKFSGSEPRLGESGGSYEVIPAPGFELDTNPPAPLFATLDRTTGLNRVGLQVGYSGAGAMSFGAVRRIDAFANYRFSKFGVYGQYSQASVAPRSGAALAGRHTIELGATHLHAVRVGGIALRGGLVVPVANDDPEGYLAASAGAYQRPTDAVMSFPASLALRTGASFTRSHELFVLQGDTGIDWIAGGANGFDALARANIGAGAGVRSVMLSAELSNTIRLTDASRRLHAVTLAATFWVNKTWLMGFMSLGSDSHTTLSAAVGYEL